MISVTLENIAQIELAFSTSSNARIYLGNLQINVPPIAYISTRMLVNSYGPYKPAIEDHDAIAKLEQAGVSPALIEGTCYGPGVNKGVTLFSSIFMIEQAFIPAKRGLRGIVDKAASAIGLSNLGSVNFDDFSSKGMAPGTESYSIELAGGGDQLNLSAYLGNAEEGRLRLLLLRYASVLEGLIEACYETRGLKSPDTMYSIGKEVSFQGGQSRGDSLRKSQKSGDKRSAQINDSGQIQPRSELEAQILIPSPNVRFSEIGGCKAGKKEMMRIYHDIITPEVTRFFGRDPEETKGYLLLGKPGTGKTLLVKALATQLLEKLSDRIRFYNVNFRDVVSMWHGQEAQRTEQLFRLAELNEENGLITLLFLDELQAIGEQFTNKHHANEALNTLLTGLDGIKQYRNLVVIGATYEEPEKLDPALIREGRLGTWIKIPDFDEGDRVETFKIYLEKNKALAIANGNPRLFDDIDIRHIAHESAGFSGSNICGVLKAVLRSKEDEARIKAGDIASLDNIRPLFSPITTEDILEAIKVYDKADRSKKMADVGFKT